MLQKHKFLQTFSKKTGKKTLDKIFEQFLKHEKIKKVLEKPCIKSYL
jgi:hypothetical protein